GTLGVITEATLGLTPRVGQTFAVVAFFPSARRGYEVVRNLREASLTTWATADPRGIDVEAIEHLDARTLELLCEDGVLDKLRLDARGAELALFVVAELPAATSGALAQDELADLDDPNVDTPLLRLCRVLRDADALDTASFALPGDEARLGDLRAFREAAPQAVNGRIGRLQ